MDRPPIRPPEALPYPIRAQPQNPWCSGGRSYQSRRTPRPEPPICDQKLLPAPIHAQFLCYYVLQGTKETLCSREADFKGSLLVCGGTGAGVAVSILACPTELIKCRLQAQSALADSGAAGVAMKYGGPMDVARHVLRSEGGVRGLFKGLFPTMAREVPGNAAMFGVYEALKQYLAGGQDTFGLGRGSLIVAGGMAGDSFWLSVYPTDVIKSVIQGDDYKNPKFSGSIDAFRKILASEGVKGLYRGFGPAMARSVPANAACFLAYEVTRSSLG
ncbi:mitochondrial carnitine/acylcarnitine carrier-like protein [Corylus avellana]|uniref:mitochondrial carnitine/acylcarnitine carrier-like protein n=1 Tax=Corylus avellana TaxID=13451 RepID=UPI00286CA38B|nr:mitochondrial carnitine/acylcarnitine carrier-like protein [Corylus avellana]